MERVFDLITYWFVYKSVTDFLLSPMGVPVILVIATILLALAGIFVQFRNGLVSALLFCLLLGGLVTASVCGLSSLRENLRLGNPRKVEITGISEEGLLLPKKRFQLTRSYQLLGVTPVLDDTSSATVMRLIDGKSVEIRSSDRFPGVVATTYDGVDVNRYLLSAGLGTVAREAPPSYHALEAGARRAEVGIWKVPAQGRTMFPLWVIWSLLCAVEMWIMKGVINGKKSNSTGSQKEIGCKESCKKESRSSG